MLIWLLALLFPWLFDGPVDDDPPDVSIVSSAADPTNVAPIPVSIVFSESVTGFEESDLEVSNAAVRDFVGLNDAYGFELLPHAESIVTVDIPAGAAADENGNGNMAAPTFSRLFDTTPPTIALSSEAPDPAGVSPIVVVTAFSEPVTGFSSDNANFKTGLPGRSPEQREGRRLEPEVGLEPTRPEGRGILIPTLKL